MATGTVAAGFAPGDGGPAPVPSPLLDGEEVLPRKPCLLAERS